MEAWPAGLQASPFRLRSYEFRTSWFTAVCPKMTGVADDVQRGQDTLTVRLGPLPVPWRTTAIAALCDWFNDTRVCYPGSSLILRFEVKDRPGTT
jgi:hypothetical protein